MDLREPKKACVRHLEELKSQRLVMQGQLKALHRRQKHHHKKDGTHVRVAWLLARRLVQRRQRQRQPPKGLFRSLSLLVVFMIARMK